MIRDYGYEFLASHGKNPVAMALSFRKLKELQGENAGGASEKINQLFSSHPDLDSDIMSIRPANTRMLPSAQANAFTSTTL